jgi:beta-glucosidase/6-phospho-beta-glucosidase/beta-galactosidase
MYLRNYLTQLQRATSEGVPVIGYFLWGLIDNFEWSDGYEQLYGLAHVDFPTDRCKLSFPQRRAHQERRWVRKMPRSQPPAVRYLEPQSGEFA